MVSVRGPWVLALIGLVACARWADPPRYGSLSRQPRPFEFTHNIELFETRSGMRFALVRDTRTNLATIDLRFDVGAAADPRDRSGLAHLVEHLLFQVRGAPGATTIWDELQEVALDFDATTSWDRTHYRSTVPIERLDEAIALEARRMTATCETIDEAAFARERDVVLAEEAEDESASQDFMYEVNATIFGRSHAYARRVGSTDVAKATKAEACAFIEANYAPDRAYLVVTGPFDVQRVRGVIGRQFGPIARRASAPRPEIERAILTGQTTRHTGPVERPTALVVFDYPSWGAPGIVPAMVGRSALAAVLADADAEHDWIVDTTVFTWGGERARVLVAAIEVNNATRLEMAADEVFLRAPEMFRYSDRGTAGLRTAMALDYLASWDRLLTRGQWITDFLQYADHTLFMMPELEALAAGWDEHKQDLKDTFTPARSHVLLITPRPGNRGGKIAADFQAGTHEVVPWRAAVDPADADRPLPVGDLSSSIAVERYQLDNGLTVELAPDGDSPIVDARLVFPVGRAHQPADQPLIATAAARLLDFDGEGYYTRDEWLRLDWALSRGTEASVGVDELATTFTARGLAHWGDWHVWRLSALIDQGRYDTRLLDAIRAAIRPGAGDERDDEAVPVFLQRLFGPGHPYATPAPTWGEAFEQLATDQLTAWKRDHYRARGATLIVSGRFDPAKMKREIDELFAPWADGAPAALPDIPQAQPATGPSWLALDLPRALQVHAALGFAAGSDPARDGAARDVLVAMIGDQLRDVREGMGASYGVHASYRGGPAGWALIAGGLIDEGKAGPAVQRMLAAIDALRDDEVARRTAFVRARRRVLAQAHAQVAGASTMAAWLAALAGRGESIADDERYVRQLAALTSADIARVTALDLDRTRMAVQLSGRRAAVDAAFAAIGVTPERLVLPEPTPRPTTGPARTTPARPPLPEGPPGELADRLSVGDPDNPTGMKREGLFQGDRAIAVETFLRVAGHGDRADQMDRRWWLRTGLKATGVLVIGGGIAYALGAESCEDIEPVPGPGDAVDACYERQRVDRLTGGAIVVAGAALAVVGFELSTKRPSDDELRRFAAEYNHVHRIPSPREVARVTDVRIAPQVHAAGAGLVLTGRF